MKYLAAISLFISALYFSPAIYTAEAQFNPCQLNSSAPCPHSQRRTRISNSITAVASANSQNFCVMWVAEPRPGVFKLQRDVNNSVPLSRGNIESAPERLIIDYVHNGLILHEHKNFGLTYGRGNFIGTMPKARAEDENGCMTKIDYERISFDLEPDANGQSVRVTLNRRDDGMIAIRLVSLASGANNEIARYVYKREGTFGGVEPINARVGEVAEQFDFVPASAYQGNARVSPARRGRRTIGTTFRVSSMPEVCTVASSDDENVSEACKSPSDYFIVTPATGN